MLLRLEGLTTSYCLGTFIILLLSILAVMVTPKPVGAIEVKCFARVTDGDTLNISGLNVRLHGIDAPERAQTCKDAEGRGYACGERASSRLRSLVDGSEITCTGVEFDQYKRLIAICKAGARST